MKGFQIIPKEERPLVLGLSATLLNGNTSKNVANAVKEAVEELETTFHAKVVTSEELTEVLEYVDLQLYS